MAITASPTLIVAENGETGDKVTFNSGSTSCSSAPVACSLFAHLHGPSEHTKM